MRTFAPKQSPSQQANTVNSTWQGRRRELQNETISSVHRWMQASGNQVGSPSLHAEAEKLEAGATSLAPVGEGHDFSRIPIFRGSPVGLHLKSMVMSPGDMYEQEADQVAEQVMRIPERQQPYASAIGGRGTHSRDGQGGHQALQTKRVRGDAAGELAIPPIVHESVSSPGQPLDPATRDFMESRLGHDFSQIRVHTGPRAEQAAEAVQAEAFTVSHDIVFGNGQYAPHGTKGQRLLAHELTHVIQQRIGNSAAVAHGNRTAIVRQSAPAFTVQREPKKTATVKAVDPAFWEWWRLVVGFEGSLSAWKATPGNKSDRGGETNWGVTKKMYMQSAKALGLSATEEGFAQMTPEQAMKFGEMIWKLSGASKIKNTGVALVLADWYWGGIDLGRLTNIVKDKGGDVSYKEGSPSQKMIDFLNTLSASDLVESMSAAKAAQYNKIAEKDATQQKFLGGWLKRNEERRKQAQPFVTTPKTASTKKIPSSMSLWDRGQAALGQAREALQMSADAGSEIRKTASDELWTIIGIIEQKQLTNGFAHAEEESSLKSLKGDLLIAVGKLMDAKALGR